MDQPTRKEKSKVKEPVSRVEKAKQKSAQQELKQRQRAEELEIHEWTRQRRIPAFMEIAFSARGRQSMPSTES
ncbi:PREDICTED: coiled-coil domain-containing protein 23 isoform 1 [Odobenus rosmarus divergens]|uniref:Coiled-coil domain-containing protein 23 isoform 1 n=1 Tax=Odobenus rosmarus divergens TaxID=9708 RepID=A0A9B0GWK8_ODORO